MSGALQEKSEAATFTFIDKSQLSVCCVLSGLAGLDFHTNWYCQNRLAGRNRSRYPDDARICKDSPQDVAYRH